MRVRVNGESRDFPPETTLAGALAILNLPAPLVAVERNREIVRREEYERTRLSDGDALEIVRIVGGG
jgi:thiamine biosynthesis protein ThiS